MRFISALREAITADRAAARQTAALVAGMSEQVASWEAGGRVTSARQLAALMAARKAADRDAAA
jgi:hypothetical protein